MASASALHRLLADGVRLLIGHRVRALQFRRLVRISSLRCAEHFCTLAARVTSAQGDLVGTNLLALHATFLVLAEQVVADVRSALDRASFGILFRRILIADDDDLLVRVTRQTLRDAVQCALHVVVHVGVIRVVG